MDNDQDKINQAWQVTTNSFGFCNWAENIQVIGSDNTNTTADIDDHIIVTYDDTDLVGFFSTYAVVFSHDLVEAYRVLKSGTIEGYDGTHCDGYDLLDVDNMDACNPDQLLQVAIFNMMIFA
tara:strand:+ start:493 stop:858 length:366 start_codon:yes stop_codon:yes gene_type:complete